MYNKKLYESIMHSIAKTVKRTLNESYNDINVSIVDNKKLEYLLNDSIVLFVFKKKDGSSRLALGTLNEDWLDELGAEPKPKALGYCVQYYDISSEGWRSASMQKAINQLFGYVKSFKTLKSAKNYIEENSSDIINSYNESVERYISEKNAKEQREQERLSKMTEVQLLIEKINKKIYSTSGKYVEEYGQRWSKSYVEWGNLSEVTKYDEKTQTLYLYFEGKAYGDGYATNDNDLELLSNSKFEYYNIWRRNFWSGKYEPEVSYEYVATKVAKILEKHGYRVKHVKYSGNYD